MDIRTMEQALKLQKDLTTRLAQSRATQTVDKVPSVAVLLKEKEQLLARAQVELQTATKERDTAVSRWDERVVQRQTYVAKLQKEIVDFKERLTAPKDLPNAKDTGKGVKKLARSKSAK